MFQFNRHHQGAYHMSLLKSHLLKKKKGFLKYIGVINVVVRLHTLSCPCWCMSVALLGIICF